MAADRSVQRVAAAVDRRPAVATTRRNAAAVAPSPPRALQQRLGNQGAQLLAAQVVARSRATGGSLGGGPSAGPLSLSHPGDTHEREADRVADAVMRTPSNEVAHKSRVASTTSPARVQRFCTECEEQQKHKAIPQVQRKEQAADTPPLTSAAAVNIQNLRGGGSALPAETRAFFEPRFGADFSHVRVHTGTRAADAAELMNANAFTVGRDIAFGAGQYAPESPDGQRLLAHELTHVVQQDGELVQRDRRNAKPDPQPKKPRFDRAEIEAIKTRAEKRHESITSFIRESRGTLNSYESRLLSAATLYRAAFGRHKKVLERAEESAADRKDMIATIAGFAAGVALGVPGAVARMGLAKLAANSTKAFAVGGELAELVVGAGAGLAAGVPDAQAFEPTAAIPELKELTVWRNIAEMSDKLLVISLLTAKQLKIVSAAGTAITEIRLREGGAKNLEKTDAEFQALVQGLMSADQASGAVVLGLNDAKAEIDALEATARPRFMTVDQVEQDIWIEWIADLTNDDLLDEDDITDHLEELNVIGKGHLFWDEDDGYSREPPRLSVDFGSWVSDEDERDAVNAARAQLGRRPPVTVEESVYDEDD